MPENCTGVVSAMTWEATNFDDRRTQRKKLRQKTFFRGFSIHFVFAAAGLAITGINGVKLKLFHLINQKKMLSRVGNSISYNKENNNYFFRKPFSRASLRHAEMPFLSMVRKAATETLSVIHLFSSGMKNRLVCKLGTNLRLVFMFECDTLFPTITLFPVNSHILDMVQFFS